MIAEGVETTVISFLALWESDAESLSFDWLDDLYVTGHMRTCLHPASNNSALHLQIFVYIGDLHGYKNRAHSQIASNLLLPMDGS